MDLASGSAFPVFPGAVSSHPLGSIENVKGSEGPDTLIGNGAANKLEGRGGNDTLNGGAGSDNLLEGSGNDTVVGGPGADTIIGPPGIDTASYPGNTAVKVNLGAGSATGDTSLASVENVTVWIRGDNLTGNGAANRLEGGLGDDALNGAGGTDRLFGRRWRRPFQRRGRQRHLRRRPGHRCGPARRLRDGHQHSLTGPSAELTKGQAQDLPLQLSES